MKSVGLTGDEELVVVLLGDLFAMKTRFCCASQAEPEAIVDLFPFFICLFDPIGVLSTRRIQRSENPVSCLHLLSRENSEECLKYPAVRRSVAVSWYPVDTIVSAGHRPFPR